MDDSKRMEIVPGHVTYAPDYKSAKRPATGQFLAGVDRIVMKEPEDGAPIDKEVVEMVDGLKRSLSKRNMRYVVRELLRALGQE